MFWRLFSDVSPLIRTERRLFERFGQIADHFAPRSGHQNVIFDPHSAHSGDVYSGLDRDHHALFQNASRAPGDARPLVDLEPDAVAKTMAELRSVTCLLLAEPLT